MQAMRAEGLAADAATYTLHISILAKAAQARANLRQVPHTLAHAAHTLAHAAHTLAQACANLRQVRLNRQIEP
jgi:hypothetical protein